MAPDQPELSEQQAAEIGTQAYIYGYPLVTMEMTPRVMTNTASPVGLRVPMGQFGHARVFPAVTYRDVGHPAPQALAAPLGETPLDHVANLESSAAPEPPRASSRYEYRTVRISALCLSTGIRHLAFY
jgi:hypothetical protein